MEDAPSFRPRWGRALGAFLFWNLAQAFFLLPGPPPHGAIDPAAPVGTWYRPLLPPLAGAALNLAVAAGFVWWFVLRPGARADGRRRAVFRLRPVPAGAWPWAAAAAAAGAVAVNAALLVLPRVAPMPRENPLVELYARLPGGALAVAALAVCVAPLLEEFFFRGWVQGALERRAAPWTAILVTAGVFAALHGLDLFGLVPRALLATGAGYAAWATGSIWPSVAMHAAYNASLFVGSAALPALLPKAAAGALPGGVAGGEAWADPERAAFFYWAHDPRVFWPALLVLGAALGAAAWALRRLGAAAGPAPAPSRAAAAAAV